MGTGLTQPGPPEKRQSLIFTRTIAMAPSAMLRRNRDWAFKDGKQAYVSEIMTMTAGMTFTAAFLVMTCSSIITGMAVLPTSRTKRVSIERRAAGELVVRF